MTTLGVRSWFRSVLVVVTVVHRVPASVVDVVDMVAVRHRHMTAARAVDVFMGGVFDVARGLALVEVPVVGAVQMPVVDIVDVIAVRYRDMSAFGAVYVRVLGVLNVCCGHQSAFFHPDGQVNL